MTRQLFKQQKSDTTTSNAYLSAQPLSYLLLWLGSIAAIAPNTSIGVGKDPVATARHTKGRKKTKAPLSRFSLEKKVVIAALAVASLSLLYLFLLSTENEDDNDNTYVRRKGSKKGNLPPKPPSSYPKATINLQGNIVSFARNGLLFRTKIDYKDENIYQTMGGYEPSEVCLTNGANPKLSPGGGGTNKYLTTLINKMVAKKKVGNKNSWGVITAMDSTAWKQGRSLQIGEYALSNHKTGVMVGHILGPKNKSEANLKALRRGITRFIQDMKDKKFLVVVLVGIGTGIYSRTAKDKRMTYQAIIDGLEDLGTKGLGNMIVTLNYWEEKDVEGLELIPTATSLKKA